MPSHLDFLARALPRRCPPFFRLPTPSHLLVWLLVSTLAAPALAQPAQASDTPAPLHYTPLTRQSPQAPAEEGWTVANRAVAEFPRGHADIVNWEAQNAADTVAPTNPLPPSSPPAATAHGAPLTGVGHTMPEPMHDKPAHPMPHGHHTHQPTTPKGGRP